MVSEKFQDILQREHVADMDFTKRAVKDFVFVNSPAFETKQQLTEWIEHADRQTS